MEMCEETEKTYGWEMMKKSGIRVLRGHKLSMRELRTMLDVEEVTGRGKRSTRSERQEVVGVCNG